MGPSSLNQAEIDYCWVQAYVGMGGKGTVTPFLKGKVRIPPPAGHFID